MRVNPGGSKMWVMDGRHVIDSCDVLTTATIRRIVAADGEMADKPPPASWTWRKGAAFYAQRHRTASGRKAGDSPSVASKLSQIEQHAKFIDHPMETTTPRQI